MDQKLRKWIKWLRIIGDDVQRLVTHNEIFRQVSEIIDSNPKVRIPSAFYDFIGQSHAAYAAMGVRRHATTHKDSISFRGLLDDIAQNPEVLYRNDCKEVHAGSVVTGPEGEDFVLIPGPEREHIDPASVRKDIRRLEAAWRKLKETADRRIAHYDRKAVSSPSCYKDIERCIALLDELYCRYHLALSGTFVETLKPTYQHDWKEIFRHPWIEQENI